MTQRIGWIGAEIGGYRRALGPLVSGYVPELLDLLVHNWAVAVSLETIYSTDITIAESQVEERVGLLQRPSRILTARFDGFTRAESARIAYILARTQHQRLLIPLYCDVTKSTTATAAGDVALMGEFQYRRFFPGQRAVVYDWSPVTRRPENAEILTVQAVTSTQLFFTGTLVVNHRAGARVIPLIESEVVLQGASSLETDETQHLELRVEEVVGNNSMSTWLGFGDNPEVPTYEQIPILVHTPNWDSNVGFKVRRAGDKQQSARAPIIGLSGLRPRVGFSLNFVGTTRAAAFQILSFIDSRNGRLRKFFVPNLQNLWAASAITTSTISIVFEASPDDVARMFNYVYIEYTDGTIIIRAINEMKVVGGAVQFTFAYAIPSSRANVGIIKHTTSAHLSRFDSDSYTENWITDGTLSVDVDTIEILDDRSVGIPYTDDVFTYSPGVVHNLIGDWIADTTKMFKPTPGGNVALTDDNVATWVDSVLNVPIAAVGASYHRYFLSPQSLRFLNNGGPVYELSGLSPVFSNALGMTIFLVVQRRNPSLDGANDYLIRVPNAGDTGTDMFEWTWTRVVMNETLGVQDQAGWIATPDAGFTRAQKHILCLTWLPGRHARVYRDGKLIGETFAPIVDFPTVLPRNVRFFNLGNPNADASTSDDSQVFRMTIFGRALTTVEINGLGFAMAAFAGTTWNLII